jgi:hypothetical protein
MLFLLCKKGFDFSEINLEYGGRTGVSRRKNEIPPENLDFRDVLHYTEGKLVGDL